MPSKPRRQPAETPSPSPTSRKANGARAETPPVDAERDAASGSQTLERGVRLLFLLAERPAGLTVSAISTEMGTHRAGIYRLVRPLEAAQLVERRPDGTYTLGLGLIGLGASVRSGLQQVAAAELQQLADEFSATCALTVRHGDEAVVAMVQEPVMARMHIAYRRGLRHPLTQAASGLAILAGDRPRPGERTEISRARRLGYAVTRNELFAGATGVAAPVLGADRIAIASISMVWLGTEIDEDRAVEALKRCAAVISAPLNGEEVGSGLAQPISLR